MEVGLGGEDSFAHGRMGPGVDDDVVVWTQDCRKRPADGLGPGGKGGGRRPLKKGGQAGFKGQDGAGPSVRCDAMTLAETCKRSGPKRGVRSQGKAIAGREVKPDTRRGVRLVVGSSPEHQQSLSQFPA